MNEPIEPADKPKRKRKPVPVAKKRRVKSKSAPAPAAADSAPAPAPIADAAAPLTLFRCELPVRWRDLDAFSHVNNSVFLTYLEEARLRWLESLPAPWLTEQTAPLIAAIHVNYRRPITWPETVAVELYAERLGNSSITLGHRILAAGDTHVLYADGYAVMVWADAQTGKAASLPDVVRNAAAAGTAEPAQAPE